MIRQNLKSLGLEERAEVVCGKVLAALPRRQADIVFLDPPYRLAEEYDGALRALGESPLQLAIAQHSARLALRGEYGRLRRARVLKQGDNALNFFERAG